MSILKLLICILAMVIVTACSGGDSGNERFDYDLQGTWEPNDKEGIYSGTLLIDYSYITITGYGEKQTPDNHDDALRPFKNFTKGVALKGYSEEGKIFIYDAGILQEGIPYKYWTEKGGEQLLRLNFNGRPETLQKIKQYP
jgi:hypothetical protein